MDTCHDTELSRLGFYFSLTFQTPITRSAFPGPIRLAKKCPNAQGHLRPQRSIPNTSPPILCNRKLDSAAKPFMAAARVYVLTTWNMVSPASCGQAHATASFSDSPRANCRLKFPIVIRGSATGLSKRQFQAILLFAQPVSHFLEHLGQLGQDLRADMPV